MYILAMPCGTVRETPDAAAPTQNQNAQLKAQSRRPPSHHRTYPSYTGVPSKQSAAIAGSKGGGSFVAITVFGKQKCSRHIRVFKAGGRCYLIFRLSYLRY